MLFRQESIYNEQSKFAILLLVNVSVGLLTFRHSITLIISIIDCGRVQKVNGDDGMLIK